MAVVTATCPNRLSQPIDGVSDQGGEWVRLNIPVIQDGQTVGAREKPWGWSQILTTSFYIKTKQSFGEKQQKTIISVSAMIAKRFSLAFIEFRDTL